MNTLLAAACLAIGWLAASRDHAIRRLERKFDRELDTLAGLSLQQSYRLESVESRVRRLPEPSRN